MKNMVEKWSAKVRHLQKLKQNRNLKIWNAECWIHEAFRENKLKWQILNNASMPKYWTELIRHFRTKPKHHLFRYENSTSTVFLSLCDLFDVLYFFFFSPPFLVIFLQLGKSGWKWKQKAHYGHICEFVSPTKPNLLSYEGHKMSQRLK